MKYLIVLVLLIVAIGIWRSRRTPSANRRSAGQRTRTQPQDMLACDHCGTHIPHNEAVKAGSHVFCSEEHRRLGSG